MSNCIETITLRIIMITCFRLWSHVMKIQYCFDVISIFGALMYTDLIWSFLLEISNATSLLFSVFLLCKVKIRCLFELHLSNLKDFLNISINFYWFNSGLSTVWASFFSIWNTFSRHVSMCNATWNNCTVMFVDTFADCHRICSFIHVVWIIDPLIAHLGLYSGPCIYFIIIMTSSHQFQTLKIFNKLCCIWCWTSNSLFFLINGKAICCLLKLIFTL